MVTCLVSMQAMEELGHVIVHIDPEHPNMVTCLVFVLLFIFVKRQIMRFAMKSRRGPHVPLGHNAPKELRQEIDSGLSKVQEIRFEPRLLSEQDDRLQSGGCYDYLYRMRALDAIRDSDIPFSELGGTPTAVTGRRFRAWLLDLRSSHSLFCSSRSSLIDTLLEGYHNARHGTGVFGEAEFVKYKEALNELASVYSSLPSVKSHSSSTSLDQHHQLAAKDLTSTPEPTPPSPPSQVTYLPSAGQRTKRPKHFLELKNFKDKYNTLESTF
ncbi:protein C1orf43-like isoform X1 [Oncorhynchus tshawytscha]|uniref:protein C1orf43-like isoform X1 n=3 Tax=Oncorhynchus TaxID=8016 RepID=UPI001C3CC0F4|nr:protein C1orf43-like isoform X1 [Oncorhynchus tshawytscha]